MNRPEKSKDRAVDRKPTPDKHRPANPMVIQMAVIDIKEISVRNRAMRARRLEYLKVTVEQNQYRVSPAQIARVILQEALIDDVCRRQEP